MKIVIFILDNLEMLSVENQKSDFPEHFHETFCISFVEKGMEAIKMQDATIYSEAGSITINNPYEIHANPIVDKDNRLKGVIKPNDLCSKAAQNLPSFNSIQAY